MSFFSGFKKKKVSAQGALVLAAMSIILSDNDVDYDEVGVLHRLINNGNADESLDELYEIYNSFNKVGDLVEFVSNSLDARQRLTVMANILDIAMADGILAENEKLLIELYLNEFQMNFSDIDSIIDVIVVKNMSL